MYIRKIELFRFKRFFLSATELVVIEPTSNIQIILGQNGIGKSSLLGMVNPLAGDIKKDFNEGGYKYIEIEHLGNEFKLLSGGKLGNKHSFIVNDVEMNPGGTISVQNELVKQYFKITNYTNSIILGTNRFTLMSYAERKNIFQDISNIDYTYSLNVYNKLKIRHRDVLGGIKIIQDSIIKTKANVIENVELDKLKYDLVMIKDFIDHVVSLYNHNVYGKDNYLDIKNNIINITRELKKNLKNNIDASDKESVKNQILILENNRKLNTDKLNTIKDTIKNISTTEYGSVDNIEKELGLINSSIENTLKECSYLNINSIEQIDVIYNNYKEIIENFVSYILDLDNYHGVISRNEDVVNFRTELENLKISYNNRKDILDKSIREYEHIISHKNKDNLVKCNNCGEEWYFKLDIKKEIELKKYIDINVPIVLDLEKKLKTTLEKNTLVQEKLIIIDNIKKFIQVNIVLKPIFIYLLTKIDIHTNRSNLMVNELNKINIQLEKWYNVFLNSKNIVKLENELNILKSTNKIIKDVSDKNLENLESELSDLINANYDIDIRLEKLNKTVIEITNIEILFYKLKKTLKEYKSSYKDSVEILRNEHLKKLTTELKNQMMDLEQKISLNNQYISKLESDNSTLLDLVNREKILKLMLKELSPTEGLIAKSINSFLNMFIQDVNVIINKIWQYDLELMPCKVNDENDLDYKFSVRVDRTEPIDDVKKLSTSMQEVVDLAFRLVYIKYAKLVDTPLILDEFARTFDVVHQVKAYDVIETLFTNNFKQIFIVSHFESMYGRFVNSEITILGSDENYKK